MMKVKVLLAAFVLTSFWSCQQNEVLNDQSNQQTLSFTSVIAGDDVLTRAGKRTSIDIVSIRSDKEQTFNVFNLRKDFRLWSELGKKDVNFYAHYPKLPENEVDKEERVLQGGVDYFFGMAKAFLGQQTVCLEFKRVAVPVYIEIQDENGNVLEARSVKLKIKNRGYQNLRTGDVTVPASVAKEDVTVKCFSNEPIATSILPQTIEKGTPLSVELTSGEVYSAAFNQNVTLSPGDVYKVTVHGSKVVVSIFDGCIPL